MPMNDHSKSKELMNPPIGNLAPVSVCTLIFGLIAKQPASKLRGLRVAATSPPERKVQINGIHTDRV